MSGLIDLNITVLLTSRRLWLNVCGSQDGRQKTLKNQSCWPGGELAGMLKFGRVLLGLGGGSEKPDQLPCRCAGPIGEILVATGAFLLRRGQDSIASFAACARLYHGDLIETGPDGAATVRMFDGTFVRIGENSRISLSDFVEKAKDRSPRGLIDVLQGRFTLFGARVGDLNALAVSTPYGRVQGRGGLAGVLSVAGLALASLRDAHALGQETGAQDDGVITALGGLGEQAGLQEDVPSEPKHLEHGVFEVM